MKKVGEKKSRPSEKDLANFLRTHSVQAAEKGFRVSNSYCRGVLRLHGIPQAFPAQPREEYRERLAALTDKEIASLWGGVSEKDVAAWRKRIGHYAESRAKMVAEVYKKLLLQGLFDLTDEQIGVWIGCRNLTLIRDARKLRRGIREPLNKTCNDTTLAPKVAAIGDPPGHGACDNNEKSPLPPPGSATLSAMLAGQVRRHVALPTKDEYNRLLRVSFRNYRRCRIEGVTPARSFLYGAVAMMPGLPVELGEKLSYGIHSWLTALCSHWDLSKRKMPETLDELLATLDGESVRKSFEGFLLTIGQLDGCASTDRIGG